MENQIKKLTLSAMLLALGVVLPFFTGQIPQIGNMLLPMHIPIFLCGLIGGWRYGAAVGAIAPLMRSLLFSMPVLYPSALAMAVELLTYGLVSGLLYAHSRRRNTAAVYYSLIIAMIAGRAAWGVAEILLLALRGGAFTWNAFMAGAFLNAVPGIVLQLILIPAVMAALNRTALVRREDAKIDADRSARK